MPSRHTTRYTVDLFPTDNDDLQEVLKDNKLKRTRFLRECIRYVLEDEERLNEVADRSSNSVYTSRGS